MGRESQIGRVVPGCSQNSGYPLLSSSVILSIKHSFLTTASHYKMAALLPDSQCHLSSEKENQDHSGRSCVSFAKAKLCRNLRQRFSYVLLVKPIGKSTLAARQSDKISILAGLIVTLKNLGLN